MKIIFNTIIYLLVIQKSIMAQVNPVFVEKNGLLVIEMESANLSPGWAVSKEKFNPTGQGYIIWTGADNFNSTGRGVLTYEIFINTPGKYRFEWRSGVGLGMVNTEHNDSWLKITADDFWGERGSETKCKPKPSCNTSPGYICPVGSGFNNFFKIYGGNWNQFQWKAATSDNNDHLIYAEFKNPGKYKIEINARSNSHLIDRMVMWDYTKYSTSDARNLSLPESEIMLPSSSQWLVDNEVTFYPNPAQNVLNVSNKNALDLHIFIRSITGLMVFSKKTNESNTFDISHLVKGVYVIEVRSGSDISTKKLVIIE
jgi:hypothetical protein